MKAIDKIREVAKSFEGSGIEAAEKEAEILIRHGLGMSTLEIYRDNPELTEKQTHTMEDALKRRLHREPLQYIVGFEYFLDLKIIVYPGVLIPRPETEFMAEQAIRAVRSQKSEVRSQKLPPPCPPLVRGGWGGNHLSLNVLDLCTGSGGLALALAKEFTHCKVYGTDISEVAIECANKNAEINGIRNVIFLKGDLFEPVEKLTSHFSFPTFDLIISNPPYIKTDDIKNLQPEIKYWEPIRALDGGKDGLDFYRGIIPSARRFLKDNGLIMLELGCGQSGEVTDILKSAGYSHIEIIKDYAGIERIIKATWKR